MIELGLSDVPGLTNRIRHMRKLRGLTLEALGERLGIDHGTVSRLERGEMKITDEYLVSISAALECSPIELIAEVEDAARTPEERETLELLRGLDPEAVRVWLAAGRQMKRS